MTNEKSIFDRVREFNSAFGLPLPTAPILAVTKEQKATLMARLAQFTDTLLDEVDEITPIIAGLDSGSASPLETTTDLADWFADIVVYALSEAMRLGIPIERVLHTVMDAQATKLGADGKALYADGKVRKGPNYVPPEPTIAALLASHPSTIVLLGD